MDTVDSLQRPVEPPDWEQSMRCPACATALQAPGRETVSFLLVDQLTIPLLGCDTHLEQLRSLCALAADTGAKLLPHRPAGGVTCPGCRYAGHSSHHPIVPLGSGRLAILACSTHESDIISRIQTGRRVRHHLDASLDAVSDSSQG